MWNWFWIICWKVEGLKPKYSLEKWNRLSQLHCLALSINNAFSGVVSPEFNSSHSVFTNCFTTAQQSSFFSVLLCCPDTKCCLLLQNGTYFLPFSSWFSYSWGLTVSPGSSCSQDCSVSVVQPSPGGVGTSHLNQSPAPALPVPRPSADFGGFRISLLSGHGWRHWGIFHLCFSPPCPAMSVPSNTAAAPRVKLWFLLMYKSCS